MRQVPGVFEIFSLDLNIRRIPWGEIGVRDEEGAPQAQEKELRRELIERDTRLVELEKQVTDLERESALRLQNETTSSSRHIHVGNRALPVESR